MCVCFSLCLLSHAQSYWLMTLQGGNTHFVAVADFALCAGLLITVLDFNIYRKKSRRGNQPLLNPTDPETEWSRIVVWSLRQHVNVRVPRIYHYCREWAHSRSLRATTAPCGIPYEAVRSCMLWYMCGGAASGGLKPDWAAVLMSINVLQNETMGMSFLPVASALGPAAVAEPGALCDSPHGSWCREAVTAEPLRSFITDSADMRWAEKRWQGGRDSHRTYLVQGEKGR